MSIYPKCHQRALPREPQAPEPGAEEGAVEPKRERNTCIHMYILTHLYLQLCIQVQYNACLSGLLSARVIFALSSWTRFVIGAMRVLAEACFSPQLRWFSIANPRQMSRTVDGRNPFRTT